MDPLIESLADLYEVALPSGAAHQWATLEAEKAEALAWVGWPDNVYDLLDKVPARTGQIHDDACFTRHAPCLAARIHDLMP